MGGLGIKKGLPKTHFVRTLVDHISAQGTKEGRDFGGSSWIVFEPNFHANPERGVAIFCVPCKPGRQAGKHIVG